MINTNYNVKSLPAQPISFTGKSFRLGEYAEDIVEAGFDKIQKKTKAITSEVYRAYNGIGEKLRLEKHPFGYKNPNGSIELSQYGGQKKNGFSTEGGGYGGGWIKADLNTPLSTKDIHTCAGLHLVNDTEHVLFHVHHSTKNRDISTFINKHFPDFHTVNIIPGDMLHTNTTVNEILEAVKTVNRKVKPNFYHAPVFDPEIIACNGKLSYLNSLKTDPDRMTFKEVDQYFYGDY